MHSSLYCFLLLSGLFIEFGVSAPAAAPAHNQLVKRLNPVLDSSFGSKDPETKQIKDAFFDALELSSYAINDIDKNDDIFKKYFNVKDKPTVRKVFKAVMGRLDPSNPNSPDKEGNALLGKIKVTRSDPDGDCKADATLMAQLTSYDTDTPLLEVCPKAGFGHGGIGKDPHKVICENLGDTVSWRMETLGSILLHEYTHYTKLMKPALPKETDDLPNGYGPNGVRAMDKSKALNNADSYSWYANEALWSVICSKSFKDPGKGDSDDPACSGKNADEERTVSSVTAALERSYQGYNLYLKVVATSVSEASSANRYTPMMLASRPIRAACSSCQLRLLDLFVYGFCHRPPARLQAHRLRPQHPWTAVRAFSNSRLYQNDSRPLQTSDEDGSHTAEHQSAEEIEGVARLARQTYGESLPEHLLSSEEYSVYERLYGPPLRAEDVASSEGRDGDGEGDGIEGARNVLLRENADGGLEEVEYLQTDALLHEDGNDALVETPRRLHNDSDAAIDSEPRLEEPIGVSQFTGLPESDLVDEYDEVEEDYEAEEDSENSGVVDGEAGSARAHPFTVAGRFSTSPSTIFLPRESFVDPVTSMLSDFSNKHLSEVARRTFGGRNIPYSTATPFSKQSIEQKPIALGASQTRMGEMEGNSYMAAVMPGAYVAVMSTLVEVRKRLGSDWIESLFKKDGGPRVLDAGAGGAGILAWREVLQAEWKRMQPEGSEKPAPLGKATVVTGSSTLRHRSSRLLENTTFLPRLPDYVHVRHEPTFDDNAPPPQRKQFDVILAPHTLWPLKEDYMRKQSVQNLWSLLNPNGGVLILIEKGLPQGFEMIAAARELILEKYISSPGSSTLENDIEDPTDERYTKKEPGMIIAPCTNHTSCPMYLTPGKSTARKDFCYFKQRYIRPPFLQRIVGAKDRSHEDVQFSYVAFRRGRDERESRGLVQGDQATDAAFFGYEQPEMSLPNLTADVADPETPRINTLGLPRAILPPIKRHGHVTLDLCTPAGRIERWTVPRSFSQQAYRDARKSKWGDLWALGAKTRVQRNVRIGRNAASKKRKGKNVFEIDVGEQGMEDVRQVTGGRVEAEKRTKKGRKERKQKKITLDEF